MSKFKKEVTVTWDPYNTGVASTTLIFGGGKPATVNGKPVTKQQEYGFLSKQLAHNPYKYYQIADNYPNLQEIMSAPTALLFIVSGFTVGAIVNRVMQGTWTGGSWLKTLGSGILALLAAGFVAGITDAFVE